MPKKRCKFNKNLSNTLIKGKENSKKVVFVIVLQHLISRNAKKSYHTHKKVRLRSIV